MFSPNIQPPSMGSPVNNERQFKPGVISFTLGLVTIALFFIGLVLFVNAASRMDPQSLYEGDSLINLSVPLAMMICCSPILSLAGMGLGIMAVVRKVDNQIFAVIGLVINSLFIVVFCLVAGVGTILG